MTLFQFAIVCALLIFGLGFGLMALALATARHHDHLIPNTPRAPRG